MEYTFRWFGPKDPSKLNHIKQIGVSGIVTSLAEIKYGEKWSYKEINKRKKLIEKNIISKNSNLKWSVVESLPVHNDIKKRSGRYKYFIDQYKDSLVNLSKSNIKTICYNFMPLIDWVRTDLNFKLPNGSLALKYNHLHVCAFENFILKSKNAKLRYSSKQIFDARKILNSMNTKDLSKLRMALLGGLAANDKKYSLKDLNYEIDQFAELNHADLRNNLREFINEIYPIIKKYKLNYNIHPDDPPYNVYGLPRILSNEKDIEYLINIKKDKQIGLTFCSGSLGVNKKNNLPKIIRKYGSYINFIHLRNIRHVDKSLDFYEDDHLEGSLNMVDIIKAIIKEEKKRKKSNHLIKDIPMRPDHGHTILHDINNKTIPGYSLLGRMKGLDHLKGIIKTII